MEPLPMRISFQRAMWGKIEGERSDYRVIARSRNFKADFHGLIPALRVGAEEQVRSAPFWRSWQGRYYAVWSYPSRVTDATNRYNFLEKQIIEWEPAELPAALGALVLLPLVAQYREDFAVSKATDSRWRNPDFELPLDHGNVNLSRYELEETVQRGLMQLKKFPDEALETFFAALLARQQPALLAANEPLGPAALAVLLLPFDREQADYLSLGGWIPSSRADREDLAGWDGIVCSPVQQQQHPVRECTLSNEIQAAIKVQMLRQPHPAVQKILEFAYGPERWFDAAEPRTREQISSLLAEGATEVERQNLSIAIDRARRFSELDSGLPPALEDARQKHLRTKVEVVRALELLVSGRPSREGNEQQITTILGIWQRNAQGELRRRIDYLLRPPLPSPAR
jgi:hypothetical protein